MFTPHARILLLPLVVLVFRAAVAQLPPENLPDDVESLVRQLGDVSFTVRHAAYERIRSIGSKTLPALRRDRTTSKSAGRPSG